ncbi:MAG: F0F1 ATP synthase subunit A [Thermoguttaceae bacterium]|jgi:F-type H+-transporting ATPase subunit a
MNGELIDVAEIGAHVSDAPDFHVPEFLGGHIHLPCVHLFGYDLQITKFMVIELAVALLMILMFVPLAHKIKSGKPVRGRFWNLLEVFLLYLRDRVIYPSIGEKNARPYVPFLWTLFFFILLCNLGGMLPWCGSPTGSIAVTAVLAGITYAVVIGGGMVKQGAFKYWVHQVPKMDIPGPLAIFLKPMIFAIEVVGNLIKHFVLAIRLLANMFAGHVILAVFLAFISGTASILWLWPLVTACSLGMSLALSCLELFVAFLQAYIFTFLAALFIGMAQHQH